MVDVAIIGGGVCGCSLLYALSRYRLQVLLLEKTNDVGVATTKANSAIVHAGYDPEPGTLMAKYNVAGNALIKQLAAALDILIKETGSLVLGFDEADAAMVQTLYERGLENGVPGLEIWDAARLRAEEPALSEAAICALYAPTAAVVNPWELAFAQAETAVKNGAEVMLDAEVTAIDKNEGYFTLHTPSGPVEARFVVNCAGVDSAAVAEMAGPAGFAITPNRGEYYILDKDQGEVVKRVIFQCPTCEGKGVLVGPTVHGNLIVGPNAEDADSTATTAEGLGYTRRMAEKSVPGLNFRAGIRNFAGLRAHADAPDFIVGPHPGAALSGVVPPGAPRFFNVAGIKSPGLTAAPAIALDVVRMLGEAGLCLERKPDFDGSRRVTRFAHLDEAGRTEAIAQNPLYGRIVCRCETVTEGEIVDALRRPLPPRSVDAVKRRCNPGMGRCQGGFCGPRVQAIIARELGLPQGEVPQDRAGMEIVIGNTKDEALNMGAAPGGKGNRGEVGRHG